MPANSRHATADRPSRRAGVARCAGGDRTRPAPPDRRTAPGRRRRSAGRWRSATAAAVARTATPPSPGPNTSPRRSRPPGTAKVVFRDKQGAGSGGAGREKAGCLLAASCTLLLPRSRSIRCPLPAPRSLLPGSYPPQRPVVQQQQHEGQRHQHRLGHQAQGKQRPSPAGSGAAKMGGGRIRHRPPGSA